MSDTARFYLGLVGLVVASMAIGFALCIGFAP